MASLCGDKVTHTHLRLQMIPLGIFAVALSVSANQLDPQINQIAGYSSDVLRHGRVSGMADDECQTWLMQIINPLTQQPVKPGPMICVTGLSAVTCKGDSGGPLILENDHGRSTQVGICSAGVDCSLNYPTYFTRVAFHMQWIKEQLGKPREWRRIQSD
ncbi:hypothetical protein MRX96_027890 [Rhipicephalus microplus]